MLNGYLHTSEINLKFVLCNLGSILDTLVNCFYNFWGNFNYHKSSAYVCCQQKNAQTIKCLFKFNLPYKLLGNKFKMVSEKVKDIIISI